MSTKSWIQLFMGITGFIVWTCDAYFGLNLPANYITFVQGVVVGTVGLALGGMNTQGQEERPREEIRVIRADSLDTPNPIPKDEVQS